MKIHHYARLLGPCWWGLWSSIANLSSGANFVFFSNLPCVRHHVIIYFITASAGHPVGRATMLLHSGHVSIDVVPRANDATQLPIGSMVVVTCDTICPVSG